MSDPEQAMLSESLKGYKDKINPFIKSTLTWDKDLIFNGRTQEGYEIDFDAHVQWGCKPTDALLLSLAGCMGIDTVMFLQKMKAALSSFKIDIVAERNPTPPQYVTAVEIILHIEGEDLNPKKVQRAVSLSQEKYCSVYNSLRDDLDVTVKYVLNDLELENEFVHTIL
ncbi:MAG: OsmC family protein [Nitrospiraceae bacterium]|nr:MAG: OsmC family protein [Nitrospiraceae bacterium]